MITLLVILRLSAYDEIISLTFVLHEFVKLYTRANGSLSLLNVWAEVSR